MEGLEGLRVCPGCQQDVSNLVPQQCWLRKQEEQNEAGLPLTGKQRSSKENISVLVWP